MKQIVALNKAAYLYANMRLVEESIPPFIMSQADAMFKALAEAADEIFERRRLPTLSDIPDVR